MVRMRGMLLPNRVVSIAGLVYRYFRKGTGA